MPDLPWFVYAMLLAPLGLILCRRRLQDAAGARRARLAVDAGQGGDLERRGAQGQGDRQRPAKTGIASRSATSPTSSTNIRSAARSCATIASASARTSAISRSPKPSRNIRSAPSSPSITIRCIRTRRCWSAICRRACGAVSGSARRSCWRSCSARRSACIRSPNSSRHGLPHPEMSAAVVAFGAFGLVIALFALALQRQASLATKWPVVPGTIKLSEHRAISRGADGRTIARPDHVPAARCPTPTRYNNVAYTNVHASLASNVASTSSWLVRKLTTGYQDGATVEGLCQSRQSVAGDAGSAHELRLAAMAGRRGDLGLCAYYRAPSTA